MTTMRVPAREMHAGDVWQVNDWRLHVQKVDVQGNNVLVVTEGPTMRHVPADEIEQVDR